MNRFSFPKLSGQARLLAGSTLLLAQLLATTEASAAPARKKVKKVSAQTVSDGEKTERKKILVKVQVSGNEAPTDEVVEETTTHLSRRYLVVGAGQSLGMNLGVKTDYSFANGLASTSTDVDYKIANAPGFSLEVWNLMSGMFWISLGGFYEPEKKIESFKLKGSEQSVTLDKSAEATFSQYGGSLSLMVAGDMPYAYVGINYAIAEVRVKDSDKSTLKYDGSIGGQAGVGLMIGEMIAVEGSYRMTNFTSKEDGTLADSSSKISAVSTMVSVKILLH